MTIPFDQFKTDIFDQFDNRWWVLTAGDFKAGAFNAMTISWGALGIMWDRPFALVVVRPTRYTYQFINTHLEFALCAFGAEYRAALEYLGSHSGRNEDKIKATGLTPMVGQKIAAPVLAEAELCLECRKIYFADLAPAHFLDPQIEALYPRRDYHRIFFGEILVISGVEKYRTAW